MRISTEADYALRITAYLSEIGIDGRVNSRMVAEKCVITEQYALKVLHKLLKGQVVKSFRGIHGGYSIARNPGDITYLEVIELIDGPLYINRCLESPSECSAGVANHCIVHRRLAEVNREMSARLRSYNFDHGTQA
ncbi:MAG: Rrf2 family transcriptional regulator [Eubacteriales bacterium]|nr:Rrf2 family transcriptional regulator [Eubacteriales bacterium]